MTEPVLDHIDTVRSEVAQIVADRDANLTASVKALGERDAALAHALDLQHQLDDLLTHPDPPPPVDPTPNPPALVIGAAISGNVDPVNLEQTTGLLHGHRTYFGPTDAAKMAAQARKDLDFGRTPYLSIHPGHYAGAYTKVATDAWLRYIFTALQDATKPGEHVILIIGNEGDRAALVLKEVTVAEYVDVHRRAMRIVQGYNRVSLSVCFSSFRGAQQDSLVPPDVAQALYGFYVDPYEHMTVNGQAHWTPFEPRWDAIKAWADKVNPNLDLGCMETGIRAEALALDPLWFDKRAKELTDRAMRRFTYFDSNSGTFGGWALDTPRLAAFAKFNKAHS